MRRVWRAVPTAVLLLGFLANAAHADRVDRFIAQLKKGKASKIRLSAAIELAKTGDQRAVPVLIDAVDAKKESDKNVRSVAATALGKLVNGATKDKLRKRAVKALTAASKKDKSSLVRKKAKSSLEAIKKIGAGGGIYVNLGAMSAKIKNDAKQMKAHMRKTAQKTFAKKASSMMTNWPGGKNPTSKQLKAKGMQAFHVDGTLTSLTTKPKGSNTIVSCKVSMLIATYPKKSMFGFLNGGAKVQAGNSPKDIQYAREDCVAAVVEDLIVKKIIPTIESRISSTAKPAKASTAQARKSSRRSRRSP